MPTIILSESAIDLLRRRLAGERVDVTDATRPLYQELAIAALMIPLHTPKGRETEYRITEAALSYKRT